MIYLGVSACFMYPDPARSVFGHKTLAYLEQDMASYLSRPDVMPILIPDLPDPELKKFMNHMDGFVFQGGADIAPSTYKEDPIENGRWPGDKHRDQYELKIMDYAFKNQKPIFAICRGMQLVNVYFGGTLYQDLKTCLQNSLEHRNAEIYDKVLHNIKCTPDSFLKNIYQEEILKVNSVHHQGIKTLGKSLAIDAISPEDGLVEAFHYQNLEDNFILGVQWHPEFSHAYRAKDVIDPAPLYDSFLEAIHKRRSK